MFKLTPIGAMPKKVRQPDELFLTLARVCGLATDRLTPSERGKLNRALKELKEVTIARGDSEAEARTQIEARARMYRKVFPGCLLTPTALAANWSMCVPDRRPEVSTEVCRTGLSEEDRKRVQRTLDMLAAGMKP